MNDVMGCDKSRYTVCHNEKTGIPSVGFHNSLQKMMSIGGKKGHNDCYRPSKPHGGGLIPVS